MRFDEYLRATKPLHHAYVIEGERTVILPALQKTLEERLGVRLTGNPDFYLAEAHTFGIADSHRLKEASALRSVKGDARVYVIAATVFTPESQNALLKTFEEATAGTHFFIVTPSLEGMLPTLLSRVMLLSEAGKEEGQGEKYETFLRASPVTRLGELAPFLKKTDDEEERKILKEGFAGFIRGLESFVHARAHKAKNFTQAEARALKMLTSAGRQLRQNGALPRIIAEHLSLALPHGDGHNERA